ncbi:hypothetical protein KIPB_000495 [Kipferlia bialata]|uniref:Uncharacterized protein n=1 Tax=Kipferlia bialata TaxID=797122 RepID=A0A9K3GF05_9EUKA|nr:hypothetical protein KIPB_000495 [Kipferlia bialata]|eukprot:g495.t1
MSTPSHPRKGVSYVPLVIDEGGEAAGLGTPMAEVGVGDTYTETYTEGHAERTGVREASPIADRETLGDTTSVFTEAEPETKGVNLPEAIDMRRTSPATTTASQPSYPTTISCSTTGRFMDGGEREAGLEPGVLVLGVRLGCERDITLLDFPDESVLPIPCSLLYTYDGVDRSIHIRTNPLSTHSTLTRSQLVTVVSDHISPVVVGVTKCPVDGHRTGALVLYGAQRVDREGEGGGVPVYRLLLNTVLD